jgi:hypothetical protein
MSHNRQRGTVLSSMVGNDSANASHNKISEMWQAN